MRALRTSILAATVALAGCRERAKTSEGASGACVAATSSAASPSGVREEQGAIAACWGTSCVAIDRGNGALSPTPMAASEPIVDARVKATERSIDVCAGTCASITPRYAQGSYSTEKRSIGGSSTLLAAVSADAQRLFVLAARMKVDGSSDVRDLEVFGDTFDVASGRAISRVDLSGEPHVLRDPSDRWSVAWLGDRVHVRARSCCGPSGADEIVDPTNGASVSLGYAHVVERMGARAIAATSTSIEWVELATPRIASTLALPNRPTFESLTAGRALSDGSIAIAFANPPGLAVVDAGTGAARFYDVPLCR